LKAITLYRIASVFFILFAVGHTVGFLRLKPPSPEARAVFDGMNNVHFQVRGSSFSYGGFYRGFGLTVTVYLLFSAFLAWHLGTLASSNPQAIGLLGWVFTVVQIASLVLSWKYFSAAPAMLSAIVAVCLGWAAWLVASKG
jgi:hypothetical protein